MLPTPLSIAPLSPKATATRSAAPFLFPPGASWKVRSRASMCSQRRATKSLSPLLRNCGASWTRTPDVVKGETVAAINCSWRVR